MKKVNILLLIIFACSSNNIPVFAQFNSVMDKLIVEEKATFGKAAYIVCLSVKLIDENATVEEALKILQEKGWVKPSRTVDSPITLGEYAFIIMKAYNMKGGLFYSIFPGSRYASKELAFKGYITGNSSWLRKISGEELLRILGRVLQAKEAGL
ncbi:MAG: hypothetical protein AB1798_16060 [Spirochaetota bacterium]